MFLGKLLDVFLKTSKCFFQSIKKFLLFELAQVQDCTNNFTNLVAKNPQPVSGLEKYIRVCSAGATRGTTICS